MVDSQKVIFIHLFAAIVQRAEKAKVAVYSCPLDIGRTETKGTVLINNASELLAFSAGEEKLIEQVLLFCLFLAS